MNVEVLVLFDYDAQADDELTIRKGDVILNVTRLEGGWWEGTLASKRGMFPDNFVTVVSEGEMNKINSPAILSKGKGRKCKALFSYCPSHADELKLAVGDEIQFMEEVEEGWWRGMLNGKVGVFPSNFVAMENDTPAAEVTCEGSLNTSKNATVPETAPLLPPKPIKEMARVIFPYEASHHDELDLKEGDLVVVLSKDCEDKGWWKGELNNKIGVFPDNFVELLPTPVSVGGAKKPERPPAIASSATAAIRNIVNGPNGTRTTTPIPAQQNSLSDEQKLLQSVSLGDEVDYNALIPPTESLHHPTASRARPTKRRPPSTVFMKETETTEEVANPVSNGSLPVQVEEPDGNQQSEQLTKEKTPPVKLPWMEDLKKAQEKRSSLQPAKPGAKPPPPTSTKPSLQSMGSFATHVQSVIHGAKAEQSSSSSGMVTTPPSVHNISNKVPKLPSPVHGNVLPKQPPIPEIPPIGGASHTTTDPSSNVQQELQFLRSRVQDLEGTVQNLVTELQQLKLLVEEERRLRLQRETSLVHI